MAEWLLYEHDDGRHAVAPSAEAATFAHGEPAWHRVGPVEVPDGMTRALQVVEAEIASAEALLNVEDGGAPVFDRAQTEAGIAALRTVAAAIQRERNAGVVLPAAPQPLADEQIDAMFAERYPELAADIESLPRHDINRLAAGRHREFFKEGVRAASAHSVAASEVGRHVGTIRSPGHLEYRSWFPIPARAGGNDGR